MTDLKEILQILGLIASAAALKSLQNKGIFFFILTYTLDLNLARMQKVLRQTLIATTIKQSTKTVRLITACYISVAYAYIVANLMAGRAENNGPSCS